MRASAGAEPEHRQPGEEAAVIGEGDHLHHVLDRDVAQMLADLPWRFTVRNPPALAAALAAHVAAFTEAVSRSHHAQPLAPPAPQRRS